jgi:DNA-binding CsgD family transcriptional regulator
MTTTVPQTELHALANLLEDARRDQPGEVVPWALLDGLLRVIPADSVQFTEVDWMHEIGVFRQFVEQDGDRGVALGVEDDDSAYFRHCRNFRACGDPMRPDEILDAVRWSDYYTDRELLNTEAYTEYFGLGDGVRAALSVRLPSLPGHARRVLFMRSTFSHFTDRDVQLLSLLRPHLHEIHLEAECRRHGSPKLTPRQWEILQLAGEGLPNGAIAERLVISPATVRKHMEHILDTLGVHSRTEAAATALPHLAGGPTIRGCMSSPVSSRLCEDPLHPASGKCCCDSASITTSLTNSGWRHGTK